VIIECLQSKVKAVQVVPKLTTCSSGRPLVWAPVVEPICERGDVDPFEAYYESRKSRHGVAPHYAFANIDDVCSMESFFKEFGFPSFEGEQLLLGEVLLEAKRLRLLMEAWGAFRASDAARTRELRGELSFALRHDAHWWYWPPLFTVFADRSGHDLHEDVEAALHTRSFLEWDLGNRVRFHREENENEGAARLRALIDAGPPRKPQDKLYLHLMHATANVCMEPVRQGELFLGWSSRDDAQGSALCLALTPVRFLGEDPEGRVFQEPYLRAPYALMFLLDLAEGREARACKDPSCRRIFFASRPDRVFCDHGCAHRSVMRNRRARVATAKRRARKEGRRTKAVR